MAETTGGSVRTERSELAEGKREDLHLGAAGGTQQRQHVIDAREQDGPADGSPVAPFGAILDRLAARPRAPLRGTTARPLGSPGGGRSRGGVRGWAE